MNNKGIVLIMALWVLMILALIAWGLSRRSSLEVSVLDTYRGKLRSYAAARAGINTVLDFLQRSPSTKDTLYALGVNIDPLKTPKDIFGHIDTGENSYAVIQYPAKNFNTADDKTIVAYGLRDEVGRININAVNMSNFQVLSALIELKGYPRVMGDKLAQGIMNYTGTNAQAVGNNAYMSSNDTLLKPKNHMYENILELLEVDGMTKEIFDKIKDDVTVYGDNQNGLRINTDTANNDVIQAVANAAARINPSTNPSDIMKQAYAIRDGGDGQSFTSDDGSGSVAGNADPNWPAFLQEGKSNYYRVRAVGVDEKSGTRSVIEAVIHTQNNSGEIISWRRE